jgi:diaminopimelate epimerase
MTMEFSKYEATGNDFILVDGLSTEPELSGVAIRELCDRRRGVGADGVILMLPSRVSDLRMRIFNADSSEAEMCGNGIRALSLFAIDRGILEGPQIIVETAAGEKTVKLSGVRDDGTVFTVDMGKPSLLRGEIPMGGPPDTEPIGIDLPIDGGALKATCVSMGNPHCVIFVENVGDCPVADIGSRVENHVLFPERTNVELVEVSNKERLMARVWERGVGETLACGTGACASLVAAKLNGMCGDRADVVLPGGSLEVMWDQGPVFLSGPARHVYDGTIEVAGGR